MKAIFAQIGAREHYEPSVMAAADGCLAALITDVWNPFGKAAVSLANSSGSKYISKLAGHDHPALRNELVIGNNRLAAESFFRRLLISDRERIFLEFIREGKQFAEICVRHMRRLDFDAFFGFTNGSLEALRFARDKGKIAVLDQIDPARVEDDLIAEESARFPGLERYPGKTPQVYFSRLDEEWATADRVIVNSAWSRSALIKQGVPESKLAVVPLPFRRVIEAKAREFKLPLKVLWFGKLCIRKGIHYALEAAKRLKNAPVEITLAGEVAINLQATEIPPNVKLVGRIPLIRASEFYRSHDLFILPTLSDGFAITQVEAMAHGLPVIATERCGEVVADGISGNLIPAGNAQALADAISTFVEDKLKLPRMSTAALHRAGDFTPQRIWPLYRSVLFERLPQADLTPSLTLQ